MIALGSPPPARDGAACVAIAALGVSNLATNRWLPQVAYVPWNLGLAAGLVALARGSGCSIAELGADPRRLPRGLRIGGAGAVVVAAGYALLLRMPVGTRLLRDDRVTSLGPRTARWHLLVRIPLGTVVAEEVAFRGVLPALLTSSRRFARSPGAVASLLFGLWHVLPSRELIRTNAGIERAVGARDWWRVVPLAVGVTTLAGAVLHSLRQRSGHLAAPVAVHLATNVLGFLGARLAAGHARLEPRSMG